MKITDEIRAAVYLELADDLDDHSLLSAENLRKRAEEKDPPRPEPGTVVWWQDAERLGDPVLGQFNDLGRIEFFGTTQMVHPDSVKYWPARILGPDEVAVKVPPVREWPDYGDYIELRFHYGKGKPQGYIRLAITRAEAEAMEAEHGE